MPNHASSRPSHALVVGASRGLGLVLVQTLLQRGWSVTATTRSPAADFDREVERSGGALRREHLDVTRPAEIAALRERLADERFDLVFVNAGIVTGLGSIDDEDDEAFTRVMTVNALAPLRVLEAFRELVTAGGMVAVMSSGQGSVSTNDDLGYELYKASKAALNQLVRSYATRHSGDGQAKLLINPGHNRTALGGPDAPLAAEDTIPMVVDVLEAEAGKPGLRFLDRFGEPMPW